MLSIVRFEKFLLLFFTLLFMGGVQQEMFSQNKNEFIIPGIYAMPEVNTTAQNPTIKVDDAVRTDLHRFQGFEILPSRYLSIPYDTFQHTNVAGSLNDVSFMLLLLLPILFLFSKKGANPLTNFLFIGLSLGMLVISIPSALMNQHQLSSPAEALIFLEGNPQQGTLGNLSDAINRIAIKTYAPFHDLFSSFSGGSDAVTYPLLFVLFLGILFLLFRRVSDFSKITKSFVFFLASYFFMWWIFGAGVIWYGMILFCLPFIFLIKGMGVSERVSLKNLSPVIGKPSVLVFACGVWMFLAFTYRAANYYPVNEERSKHIYIPPFTEYQVGNLTEDKLFQSTFPNSIQLKKILNQEDKSLVYRVGTQFNFFIQKNDSRVYSDTFLGFFERMVRKFKDKRKIMQALRARGFKYIIFDLNLAANDQTPNKSLTRKFTNFLNSLFENPEVELVLTNRTLRKTDTGQVVYGVFPSGATLENQGTFAVFKIK